MQSLIFKIMGITLLFTTSVCNASVVYSYTGNTYTTATAPYNTLMRVTFDIELDALLDTNLTNHAVSPISFNASDGVNTLSESTPSFDFLLFQFTTDSAGTITNWAVKIGEPYSTEIGPTNVQILSYNQVGFYGLQVYDVGEILSCMTVINGLCNVGQSEAYGNVTTSGTWQVTAVPIPPALYLFSSGLLALIGKTRRKQLLI